MGILGTGAHSPTLAVLVPAAGGGHAPVPGSAPGPGTGWSCGSARTPGPLVGDYVAPVCTYRDVVPTNRAAATLRRRRAGPR